MCVEDLVERDRRPPRPHRPLARRRESDAFAIGVHQKLDRRLALRARDADDPGRLEPAEEADLGARVIRAADAAVVVLRLLAQAAEDVHLRSSIAEAAGSRPSRQARNAYWSARSSTCLSSGFPMPWPASWS